MIPPRQLYARVRFSAADIAASRNRPTGSFVETAINEYREALRDMIADSAARHLWYLGERTRPIFGNLYMPGPADDNWFGFVRSRTAAA